MTNGSQHGYLFLRTMSTSCISNVNYFAITALFWFKSSWWFPSFLWQRMWIKSTCSFWYPYTRLHFSKLLPPGVANFIVLRQSIRENHGLVSIVALRRITMSTLLASDHVTYSFVSEIR